MNDAGFGNVETIYNSIDVEAISSKANYQYDNKNQSFAGLFVTNLNVNKENIDNSIQNVYNSVLSERVKNMRLKDNISFLGLWLCF